MMKKTRKNKERKKAKVQQGGYGVKLKKPRNSYPHRKTEKTEEQRRCRRKLKMWKFKQPQAAINAQIRSKEQSMEKNHTFNYE